MTPRRYRLAMLAYPARYRSARGDELMATLAEGDDERGGPSTPEALALAYRGLLKRAGIALSGDGLLVIAAGLALVALFFGLTWTEIRIAIDYGITLGFNGDPGTWATAALTIAVFTVLAAGPGRAAQDPRRRKRVAAIAFFAALVVWVAPGSVVKYTIPDMHELATFLWVDFTGIFANWQVTLPFAATTAAGTWLALLGVSRLPRHLRRPVLGAGLFLTGAVAVGLSLRRPDFPVEYSGSAFADLGAAAFVTAASALVALAACARRSTRSS